MYTRQQIWEVYQGLNQPLNDEERLENFNLEFPEEKMTPAQISVQQKMQYVINLIGQGPLSSIEEGELLENLQGRNNSSSLWGIAIKNHFEKEQQDHKEFIAGLASQCQDDIFTMACVVGLGNAILLLRTIQN